MQATIAAASSPAVADGSAPLEVVFSEKIGRTISVHAGQMAGAAEPRFATSIPAKNVP
jgi:hypothetical protein